MTYADTLAYIYTKLPMFQRIGAAAYKKDLTNITALSEALGNPHTRFPTIHVAGTNGKGSTCYMLAAILQAAGYKTGLYISPHYKDFRERIKINGQMIPKRAVVKFIQKMQPAIEDIQPSFFEIGVAMAFDYFATENVDIAVIETGLGGRLDSTNIITPLLSIITNISFDHQNLLGDTLPQIAGEKAGIIKPQVPVVIGEEQAAVKNVFLAKAKALGAPISFASQHLHVSAQREEGDVMQVLATATGQQQGTAYTVNLSGPFQERNIATVLHSVEQLRAHTPLRLPPEAVAQGLANVKSLTHFIGRWHRLRERPLTIADSAHNEGGLRLTLERIQELPHKELHIVVGMVNDKAIDKMLALFPPQATYYFCKANIPRGLAADSLQAQAATHGLRGKAYTSVKRALQAAFRKASLDDVIYVGGSTFVVAEVI